MLQRYGYDFDEDGVFRHQMISDASDFSLPYEFVYTVEDDHVVLAQTLRTPDLKRGFMWTRQYLRVSDLSSAENLLRGDVETVSVDGGNPVVVHRSDD